MTTRTRPYVFYDATVSLCAECLRRVDAKVVFEDGRVYLLKRCAEHGRQKVLIADDVAYYRQCREDYLKPPEMPLAYHTPVRWGCPYDCGLCPDHEQHSCLTLVELTDACNLRCPVCYAGSGPEHAAHGHRPVPQIRAMLDAVVRSEGRPDVVQLSGGEPTEHPAFAEILRYARTLPIRHLMVNTNGIRIGRDPDLLELFAERRAGFEVYLQFDSLRERPIEVLRGADLLASRFRALEQLERHRISTTLVVTLRKGLNDDECGAIIEEALKWRCVRGVTFQPIQDAGRNIGFDPARDRLTLSEVRRRILEQSTRFTPEDLIPVPCHADSLAMAYALKRDGEVTPLTRHVDPAALVADAGNTIVYEHEHALQRELMQKHALELFATNHSPESSFGKLAELLCCLPRAAVASDLSYENLFRVIIMDFIDAHSFDLRSIRKTCVHIAHPDGRRLIPFDTYNLFYRGDLEQRVLAPLRAEREGHGGTVEAR